MIDLHTHTYFSDGELGPAELAVRAKVAGYSAISITDHCDYSNLDLIVPRIVFAAEKITKHYGIITIPGVELTYVAPEAISEMADAARKMGAKIIVVHGETTAEPVPRGTNKAAILANIDILAHPGLITKDDIELAVRHGVHLEITTRPAHRTTNGHLMTLARLLKPKLVINNDTHSPGDLLSEKDSFELLRQYGLNERDFLDCQENSERIVLSKYHPDGKMDVILAKE